jgi:hypothetical protein
VQRAVGGGASRLAGAQRRLDGQYNGVFTGYHCGMAPMARKPLGTVGGGRGPEAGETAADVRWCGKEEEQ